MAVKLVCPAKKYTTVLVCNTFKMIACEYPVRNIFRYNNYRINFVKIGETILLFPRRAMLCVRL